jgi:HAD superfamily phosphatase
MKNSVLVFDMDGVLADVNDSYLSTIALTVKDFTGAAPGFEVIEKYKQAGGWNNDWALAHHLIEDAGRREVSFNDVVAAFQSRFLGCDHDGLILQEKWIPAEGLLERLTQNHALAIFSGRPRPEIDFTLQRFAPAIRWDFIIADEDVARAKPAPDGLHAVRSQCNGARLTYVGDSIDDARSARAAEVPFIGIARPDQLSLKELLQTEGARVVIPDVNHLERIL